MKGAVIASDATPDKNILSTDSLTYSDIQNHAEYSASSVGVNVNTNPSAERNEQGVTPNIGVTAKGDADSTTKSAISPGMIEVRSGNTDLSKLSRDTENAVNTLGKIFDKKTVQEQQELAQIFGEEAFKLVHKISKENGWEEGSPQKIALHAFVGAVMADLGGGNVLSGAVGAGVNEAIQKELADKFKDDPDLHQWASFIIGSAAASVIGGDATTGGSTAVSGTKNNFLSDWQKEQLEKAKADGNEEAIAYWTAVDKAQDQIISTMNIPPGTDLNDQENYNLLQNISILAQEVLENPDLAPGDYDGFKITDTGGILVLAGAVWVAINVDLKTLTLGAPTLAARAGDVTPNGLRLTQHAVERTELRGFTLARLDNVVSNYSQKVYQPGGLEVYAKKIGNFYDVVIVNSAKEVVTVVGGNTGSLRTWSDVTRMLNNNGGYSSLPW
ncbi:DUF637 domain-containing protein|uniref:Possible hemagglutinin n=1 Tax=Dendrosporobacter quercicolus TaxID=146817 RepID=A0A1G9W1B4_9FIRM|nr:DUF637 domain-containing protein [Dendrosporobacter quercicolus]NSL47746.1 DUF637 domain-containing protein [Dendrosporobacter quercicolus DSM 1736]SDM78304.1 Possible hemagglutinin [Dendrosporobacter quercicolus]